LVFAFFFGIVGVIGWTRETPNPTPTDMKMAPKIAVRGKGRKKERGIGKRRYSNSSSWSDE